jgi:hypothetical protein
MMVLFRRPGRNYSGPETKIPRNKREDTMALPKDFLHHLHEIMVEVSDTLRDEAAAQKGS